MEFNPPQEEEADFSLFAVLYQVSLEKISEAQPDRFPESSFVEDYISHVMVGLEEAFPGSSNLVREHLHDVDQHHFYYGFLPRDLNRQLETEMEMNMPIWADFKEVIVAHKVMTTRMLDHLEEDFYHSPPGRYLPLISFLSFTDFLDEVRDEVSLLQSQTKEAFLRDAMRIFLGRRYLLRDVEIPAALLNSMTLYARRKLEDEDKRLNSNELDLRHGVIREMIFTTFLNEALSRGMPLKMAQSYVNQRIEATLAEAQSTEDLDPLAEIFAEDESLDRVLSILLDSPVQG